MGFTERFFKLWPIKMNDKPWELVVRRLYAELANLPIMYTPLGDRWLTLQEALFIRSSSDKTSTTADDDDKLLAVLLKEGLPVVRLPEPILQMFQKCGHKLQFVNPALVKAQLMRPGKRSYTQNRENVLILLDYFLKNLTDASDFDLLDGLKLVPLWDGTLGTFNTHSYNNNYHTVFYIAGPPELDLLTSVKHVIVDPSVSHMLLASSTIHKYTNVQPFTLQHLCTLLGTLLLPREWKDQDEVKWTPGGVVVPAVTPLPPTTGANRSNAVVASVTSSTPTPRSISTQPTVEWINNLWKYLSAKCDDLSVMTQWPLLPTNEGYLCRLSPQSKVIRAQIKPKQPLQQLPQPELLQSQQQEQQPQPEQQQQQQQQLQANVQNEGSLDDAVMSLLLKIGCRTLMCTDNVHVQHPRLHEYTQACTPLGVLSAIYVACNMEIPKISLRFKHAQVAPQELQQLRKFVGKFNWHNNQHPLFKHVLKALPMYEVYNSNSNHSNNSSDVFVSVTNDKHFIPPAAVSEALLTENFIKNTSGTCAT